MQKDKNLHKMHHNLFLQTNKNEMKKYFIGLQNWRSQTSTFLQKVLKFFSWKNVWQNFVAGEMADTMADPETDMTILLCPITVCTYCSCKKSEDKNLTYSNTVHTKYFIFFIYNYFHLFFKIVQKYKLCMIVYVINTIF